MKHIKVKVILSSILILGLLLRILNPTYGSPVLYVTGDEAPNYIGALLMMENTNLLIDTAIYPPFGSYIQIPFLGLAFISMFAMGKVHSFTDLKLLLITHEGYFLFVPRLISGVLGTATIFIVYKITNLLFSKKTSLIAALLFSLSFNHIQMSHSGRPWIPAIFFFSLSLFYSLKTFEFNSQIKNSILANVYAVVAFGFHQIGIVAVWLFLLMQTFREKISLKHCYKNMSIRLGLIISIIGVSSLVLINKLGPTSGWLRNSTDFPSDYPLHTKIIDILVHNQFLYHLHQFLLLEPIIFIFFILSLSLSSSWKDSRKVVLIFTLSSFLLISFSFAQPRYMLPVTLVMCIFAAHAIYMFVNIIKSRILSILVVSIILFVATIQPLLWNYLYIQEPTFIQAKKWIEQNIPPESVILTTSLKFTGFTPAKEVLSLQQQIHKGFYQAAGNMLKTGDYPDNVRNIIYLDKLENINNKNRVPNLLDNFPIAYSYIMDLYWEPSDSRLLYVNKDKLIKRVTFSPMRNKSYFPKLNNLLASMSDPPLISLLIWLERTGLYVDIYELKQ